MAYIILLIIVIGFIAALFIIYNMCFKEYRVTIEEELVKLEKEKDFYGKHYETIRQGIINVENDKSYTEVEVTAFDGVKLKGRYYEREKGAPTVIFMHGYHGTFQRDGMGVFSLTKRKGYNLLFPYERGHGLSEGKAITFGIKERRDVKTWVEYILKWNGSNQKIVIAGLSMGAATVMMAAELELPKNVKGIMADCGYSSPREILCHVMKSMKMPPAIMYPIARLSAWHIGGFALDSSSAVEGMKKCTLPVLFIHGEGDDFVPTAMSVKCHEVCSSEKEILLVPEAGHGMSYCYDAKGYEDAVLRFFEKTLG